MLVFGPIQLPLDLIWVSADEDKQTFRDKICCTYVLKRKSVPSGRGKIVYRRYFIFGMSLPLREVMRTD